MDRFHIILSPRAVKDLDSLSDTLCTKIIKAIKVLEENPFTRGKLIKKIKGKHSDFYRLRVDKYRVFYMIESSDVVVLKILSKKDADRFISNLN